MHGGSAARSTKAMAQSTEIGSRSMVWLTGWQKEFAQSDGGDRFRYMIGWLRFHCSISSGGGPLSMHDPMAQIHLE